MEDDPFFESASKFSAAELSEAGFDAEINGLCPAGREKPIITRRAPISRMPQYVYIFMEFRFFLRWRWHLRNYVTGSCLIYFNITAAGENGRITGKDSK